MKYNNPLEKLSLEFKDPNFDAHFFKSIYNKKIHLLKSVSMDSFFDKNDLEDLFLTDGIEEQLHQINAHENNVRTVAIDPKKSLPIIAKLKNKEIDVDEFIFKMSDGYGLKVYSVHILFPKLKRFSHELFLLFNRGININIYIINGEKKGYDLHLDSGAYFIKQISGEKEWNFPLDEKGEYLRDDQGLLREGRTRKIFENKIKDYQAFMMKENDCLHFPVGYPHYALSKTKQLSVHLTIAIHEYRSLDFANFVSSYILHDKFSSPLQCIEQNDGESVFLNENMEEFKEKWQQYLLHKNMTILKQGYLKSPPHLTS